jgi:carboxynorspermidine decarboxylase
MTSAQQFNDRLLPLWTNANLVTPAFVYDELQITEKLELLAKVSEQSGCRVLYSIKALSFAELLKTIAPYVDGYSVSSLFEAKLAREIIGDKGSIHLTSPGIREPDMQEIAEYCDYLSFNSLSQWQRCKPYALHRQCGLRINPALSFVKDERYDPCRTWSKLGVPLAQLDDISTDSDLLDGISGIHIHNNCEASDFHQLEETVNLLLDQYNNIIARMRWLNFGGGYYIHDPAQLDVLNQIIDSLKQQYNLEIFFEPGKGVVGHAGYLVASVIDIFDSGGKTVAVLDTTVNHLPEVFEYQYKPVVLQESATGKYNYRLAGASCLSGDLFGDYNFDRELQINSRIIFANMGAYMMVKANMFNGINLPTIYSLDRSGKIHQQLKFNYQHYRDRL